MVHQDSKGAVFLLVLLLIFLVQPTFSQELSSPQPPIPTGQIAIPQPFQPGDSPANEAMQNYPPYDNYQPYINNFAPPIQECDVSRELMDRIVEEVDAGNPDVVKDLPECYKAHRGLMIEIVLTDSNQFQYASNLLKSDENFIQRLVKIDPIILKYVTKDVLSDAIFMERAANINRNSLQYADPSLIDYRVLIAAG